MTNQELRQLQLTACDVRKCVLTATHSAKSGHPGGSLSAADLFTYLYFHELRIDPKNPKWADRDRFVLSKGHTAPGLYGALALRGYFPVEDLTTLRHIDSYLQGHPNMNTVPGIDMSTGSLGQGISTAVGMAKGAKYLGKDVNGVLPAGRWRDRRRPGVGGHRCSPPTTSWTTSAPSWTMNGLQIDGRTADVMNTAPLSDKFAAFGYDVTEIDGHDFTQLEAAFAKFHANAGTGKPTMILMHTTKGKGVSYMEDQAGWHGKAPNDERIRPGHPGAGRPESRTGGEVRWLT